MKYPILVLFAIFLSLKIQAQNQKANLKNNEITIPLNSELKISLKESNGTFSKFKIINEFAIAEPIEMMAVLEKIEKKEILSNEIEFKFSEANFMGSKLIILTTVQHFSKPIIFKAKIRLSGNDDYVETSIVPKAPNVFSVEQWQDDIVSIKLSDFKFVE